MEERGPVPTQGRAHGVFRTDAKQSKGVDSWVKELLMRAYVAPGSNVADLHPVTQHVGKMARVGVNKGTSGVTRVTFVGSDDKALQEVKKVALARREASWEVRTHLTDGKKISLPETGAYDTIVCLSDSFTRELGTVRLRRHTLRTIADGLKPGGVLITTVLDSGVLYRKLMIEHPHQHRYSSAPRPPVDTPLFTVEATPAKEKSDPAVAGSVRLVVRGEAAPRCSSEPLVNLANVLHEAEKLGLEVVESQNFLEFLHTHWELPACRDLLVAFQVFSTSKRILPDEKELMELYSTLVLRKHSSPLPSATASAVRGGVKRPRPEDLDAVMEELDNSAPPLP